MTLTATAFVLSLETGQVAGMGLLCPDARYGSVLWTGATRVDRRFAQPNEWQAVQRELSETMPAAALPRTSACAALLAGAQGARSPCAGCGRYLSKSRRQTRRPARSMRS